LPNGYDATATNHVAYVEFGSFHLIASVLLLSLMVEPKVRTSPSKVIYGIPIRFNEISIDLTQLTGFPVTEHSAWHKSIFNPNCFNNTI
jgi:hypothetical protein